MKKATLVLDDGTRFEGESFGYEGNVYGEVVFNTAMTGYPESLTDPSYAGQIMVLTYPLVGNYGVPSTEESSDGIPCFIESDRIYVTGLVIGDYSEQFSHWNARESLSEWLKREKVPGITGIDTRRLTQILREHGVMMGRIIVDGAEGQPEIMDYNSINYVNVVSTPEIKTYKPVSDKDSSQPKKVLMVDCGAKNNIIRCLTSRGVEVIRVPWNHDFNNMEFDGLFISNGPGNPEQCEEAIKNIRKFISNPDETRPLMGICMGNQLLAKAAGAGIYKLKYGHRSHNQPVRMEGTNRCFITSQNHGFAVDPSTLEEGWEPYFTNMNDGSNEGIRHITKPWYSSQFHPEASGGPVDTEFLFDDFVAKL